MIGKQVVLQEYCKKKTGTYNSDINSKKKKAEAQKKQEAHGRHRSPEQSYRSKLLLC